jgi:hypothetical protein
MQLHKLRAVWPKDRRLTGAVEELLRIAVHTRHKERSSSSGLTAG